MTLYINHSDVFYFDILIDKNSFFKQTHLDIKTKLLEKAIDNLEFDIRSLVKTVENNRWYSFFWEFTYDIYRDDGIKGTVADYYLLEIIKYISEKYKIKKIEIQYPLRKPILKKISEITPIELKISKIDYVKDFIRFQFGAFKYMKRYLIHAFYFSSDKKELEGENKVFFLTSDNFSTSRYKEFPVMIDNYKDVYLMNLSLLNLKRYSNDDEYQIRSYSVKLLFTSFFKALNLYKSLKFNIKNLKQKTIYSQNLNKQSFTQTYHLMLRFEALKRIFTYYKPEYLVVATTVGDPLKRMALSVAKSCGIKTIVFSCRSILSYLRAEDRVIDIDFNKLNSKFFTDYFISFDKISKQQLIRSGVDQDIIYSYNEDVQEEKQTIINDGYLLLFAGSSYNNKLIDLFEMMLSKGYIFNNIYYREHPLVRISKDQLLRLKKVNNSLICLTDNKWNEFSFENVIAVTSNSTSGIDASSCGASIVWLPFLTEHSTQFKPMMDAIGKTCYDENEFFEFLKILKSKTSRLDFNEKCKTQYKQNIYEESNMNQLFKQL